MWNLASICLEMVLVLVKGERFAPNLPLAQKSFWTNRMVHLGDEAQIEAHFSPFGDSANLEAWLAHGLCQTYHRLKIALDAPGGTPR
jgi:hypothetical protein